MRRVVRCLSELNGEVVSGTSVVSLWDEAPDASSVPPHVTFFPGYSAKLKTAACFLRQVQVMQPDAIIYDHVMLCPMAVPAHVISRGSRQILFVYGTEVWDKPEFRKVPTAEMLSVRRCIDQVVSISDFTAVQMAKAFKLPTERFRLLPCAVDLNSTALQDGTDATPQRPGTLLTVSRMGLEDRYKGIDKVILAMPQVLAAFPQTRYVVVGDGALRPELMALAAKTGVASRVRFLGRLDDAQLQEAYASADVFLMPSTGEGFGIVFLEAWKHRLPVICGNRDASAEVVTDGVNGLTVNPGDSRAVAEAAMRLLSDHDLAHRLGKQGFQTLAGRYTHERFRTRLTEILTECSPGCCGGRGGHSQRCAY
jgi:phosphatidylinositol alpha-1,6-mannosyltransferase